MINEKQEDYVDKILEIIDNVSNEKTSTIQTIFPLLEKSDLLEEANLYSGAPAQSCIDIGNKRAPGLYCLLDEDLLTNIPNEIKNKHRQAAQEIREARENKQLLSKIINSSDNHGGIHTYGRLNALETILTNDAKSKASSFFNFNALLFFTAEVVYQAAEYILEWSESAIGGEQCGFILKLDNEQYGVAGIGYKRNNERSGNRTKRCRPGHKSRSRFKLRKYFTNYVCVVLEKRYDYDPELGKYPFFVRTAYPDIYHVNNKDLIRSDKWLMADVQLTLAYKKASPENKKLFLMSAERDPLFVKTTNEKKYNHTSGLKKIKKNRTKKARQTSKKELNNLIEESLSCA